MYEHKKRFYKILKKLLDFKDFRGSILVVIGEIIQ